MENKENFKVKRVLYSILLFIPLYIVYYFLIAFILGFILSFFGEYMHYYGIILGFALFPLAAIITILKINKKIYNDENSRKSE